MMVDTDTANVFTSRFAMGERVHVRGVVGSWSITGVYFGDGKVRYEVAGFLRPSEDVMAELKVAS